METEAEVANFCYEVKSIHSPGLWGLKSEVEIFDYPLPRLQLQLIVIFVLTQGLHAIVFKRFNFQRLVAEITAGIILGPTFMGKIPGFTAKLFPAEGELYLDILSKLGYIFFMFLIGVKMDPITVSKAGRKAWIIGLISVLAPVATSNVASYLLDAGQSIERQSSGRAMIGIQTLTPFAVVAHLLIDLKLMNSEIGRLALSASLISDMISTTFTTLLTVMKSIVATGWKIDFAWVQSPVLIMIFLIIVYGTKPVFLLIVKHTPQGKLVKGSYVVFTCLVVIISSILGDIIGLPYQLPPFLIGLLVPSGPPLGSTLVDRLETMIVGLFAPIMVTNCGLQFDLTIIYDLRFNSMMWIVFMYSTVFKILSVFVPAFISKMPIKDSAALAVLMSSQGIVQLASFMNYFSVETIDRETFGAGTVGVLIMGMTTAGTVRSLYDKSKLYAGYKKRDLEHLSDTAELKLLACTHRLDDVFAVIKLLEVANPTKEIPIIAYVLHMVELVGSTTPVLINHGLGQRTSQGASRSKDVVDTCLTFELQTHGAVQVHPYTSMSMSKFMQEDICFLAFDKLVSFIILPFHKKWNQQGKVILDNAPIRSINRIVLETAPCSVGILVDRRKMKTTPSDLSESSSVYRVAVVFLEGNDDREALSYARRFVQSPGVHISIIRLVMQESVNDASWETIIDTECINDMKRQYFHLGSQVYKDEIVQDGSDTATIIRELSENFDLIVTGRRHREDLQLLSGLTEWMELPELGPVGDLLASEDIEHPVSVLIVQQQLIQA